MSEKIIAEARTEFGKGYARRLRAAGRIPAVIYGHGSEATHFSLPGHQTTQALRKGGAHALLELELDGEILLGLVKDIQVDPIRRVIEHVDLILAIKGETVTVEVPVVVVGAAVPGTTVVTEHATLEVTAEALHVPEQIEVSVAGIAAGTQILASDVVLPEGVALVGNGEALVVNVIAAEDNTEAPAEEEAPAAE